MTGKTVNLVLDTNVFISVVFFSGIPYRILDAWRKPGHGIRGTDGWDQSMVRAKNQAERYVRALPAAEGRPPFLLVADVGHAIEIYSDLTHTGGIYTAICSFQ